MFSSMSRRRVLLLVVLTCVLLITLDKRGNPVIDRTRSVFAACIQPVRHGHARRSRCRIERAWNGITNYDDLAARERGAARPDRAHEGQRHRGPLGRCSSTASC